MNYEIRYVLIRICKYTREIYSTATVLYSVGVARKCGGEIGHWGRLVLFLERFFHPTRTEGTDLGRSRACELCAARYVRQRGIGVQYNSVLAQPELATPRSRGRDLDGRGQFRHDPEGFDLERSERDHALLGPAQRRCLAPRVWRVRRGLALHAPASAVAAARQ